MKFCKMIKSTIPKDPVGRDRALRELQAELRSLSHDGFAQITVSLDPDPILAVLVNGQSAWLMCLRYDGDLGFSSRNPDYTGPSDRTIPYVLSTGQEDEYPADWAFPTDAVLEAIEHFAVHGRVPAWISWHNDSNDGAVSPNDPPRPTPYSNIGGVQ